jgi:hypothetical protein
LLWVKKGNTNMQRRFRRLLAAFAGLLILAMGTTSKPAIAQSGTSRLDGTVRTPGGAPLNGVFVEILSGATIVASQGSVNGTISFPPLLPAGTLTLRATLPAQGSTPASTVTQAVTLTAGATTTAAVVVPSALPVVHGKVLINGVPVTHGSSFALGVLNWSVNAGADLRSDPQTTIISAGLSNGEFSLRRPANAVYFSTAVTLTGTSVENAGQRVSFIKTIPNYTPAADDNLGTIDFAVVSHTMNFINADGSPASGHMFYSNVPPGGVGVGGLFHSFSGPVSASISVPSLAVSSSYSVFPTSTDTTVLPLGSGPLTPASGGTTNVTLFSGPVLSGRVLVNGVAVPLNANATIGGMSWAVTGGIGMQMTAPIPASTATARGWSGTTGNINFRFPVGTYRVRIVLNLTGNGPTNTGIVLRVEDLRPGTVVNGNLNLGTTDYQLVNHTLSLVNADGSTGSGNVIANTVGSVNGTTDLTTSGVFYRFAGQVNGSFTTPALAGSLDANVFPGTDTTVLPYVSTPITVAAGTTSTLTLNSGPVVRGRLLINGQPVGSSVVLGGNTWTTSNSGVTYQPVGTTTTPIAVGLRPDSSFASRVPAGTYLVRATINLTGATGTPAFQKTFYFSKVIASQAVTADTDIGDLDFQTVDETVRLVNRDGTPGSGNVELTNLTGTPTASGSYYLLRGEVTGSFVVPALAVPSRLTVRTSVTSAVTLSNSTLTPSAGAVASVVLGGAANVVVGSGDDDGDGILDLLEASAPNQDVDGNGVLDHQQKNIASLPVAGNSNEYISIAVDASKTLTEVSTAPISSAAVAPPAGTTFPSGLVKFTIPAVPASSDVTVRLYVTPAIAAQLSGYAKYNVATQLWTQMPADRVTINATAGWLDVRLTDNGIGDDDPTVGKISDPGAPLIGSIARKTGSDPAAVALVFSPISSGTPSSQNAAAVTPTQAPATPASPGAPAPSTTVPATVPASVLVQTTPIPPAPAPAAALPVATVEPAYTGSTPAPLVAVALVLFLLGYLLFWATSHRGKATLKRVANRRKLRELGE